MPTPTTARGAAAPLRRRTATAAAHLLLALLASALLLQAAACRGAVTAGDGAGGDGTGGDGTQSGPAITSSLDGPRLGRPGAQTYSMAFPSGVRATSAVMLEKEMPREVIRGVEFEYRLAVENLTDRTLDAVEVVDALPEGLEVTATEPEAKLVGRDAIWRLGALPPHSTKNLSVRAVPGDLGKMTTRATVTYEARLAATAEVIAPSLELELLAPAEALACDPLPVTFRVENVGMGDAREVRVVEELPEGLRTSAGRQRVVLDFGTLAGGQSKERTVEVLTDAAGPITQSATAEGAGGLSAESAPITTVLRSPRLTVAIEAPERIEVMRPMPGRVVVSNTGDAPTEVVEVRVELPAGTDVQSASVGGGIGTIEGEAGVGVTWDLQPLAVGESREFTYVAVSPTGRAFIAEVEARGRCAGLVTATARTVVEGRPAVAVEATGGEAAVGEDLTVVLVLENHGSSPDTGLTVSCVAPEGVTIASASGGEGALIEGARATFEPIPELAPGARVVLRLTLTAEARAGGDVRVELMTDDRESTLRDAARVAFDDAP